MLNTVTSYCAFVTIALAVVGYAQLVDRFLP